MQPVTPKSTFIKSQEMTRRQGGKETRRFFSPCLPLSPSSFLALLDDLEIDQSALDLFKSAAGRSGIDHVDAPLGALLSRCTPFRCDQNLAVFAVDRKRLHFYFLVLVVSHLTPPLLGC